MINYKQLKHGEEESQLQSALLNWYDRCGRRALPWRKNISDYRVWLSEVMLQQTQVKTVLPYYQRFLDCFSNVNELAQASRDKVLSLWSGLGYYTRAKNLHLTAEIIRNDYDSVFPNCALKLQSLPGIGKSTAHAILAITHDLPFAILDGNVKRVLSRVYCIDGPVNQTQTLKKLWQASENLVPNKRPRDYTQAMMDLGAMICTRTKPHCTECPISASCEAYKNNMTHLFPIKTKRKALPTKRGNYACIINEDGMILLQKRPDSGLWAGLWQFPEFDDKNKEPFFRLKHTFSHFHLDMCFHYVKATTHEKLANQKWFNESMLQQVGIPKPFSEVIQKHFRTS